MSKEKNEFLINLSVANIVGEKPVEILQVKMKDASHNRQVLILKRGKFKTKHSTVLGKNGWLGKTTLKPLIEKFTFRHGVFNKRITFVPGEIVTCSEEDLLGEISFLRDPIPQNLCFFLKGEASATPLKDGLEEKKARKNRALREVAEAYYKDHEMSGMF